MKVEVLIPKVGMGTTEGTIAKWHKAVGQFVKAGEPLVDIEFAKAIEEVGASSTGRLMEIRLQEGATADVHTVIAIIEQSENA